jgi:hypothetical protein
MWHSSPASNYDNKGAGLTVGVMPCNEEKERKGKIEDPSGRNFSAERKAGRDFYASFTLGLTWLLY